MEKNIVIFDMDGTLALREHRLHLIERPHCEACRGIGSTMAPNRSLSGGPAFVTVRCDPCAGTGKTGKPDFKAFEEACINDLPNLPVIAALRAHRLAGHFPLIVSGRSNAVRPQTEDWLFRHVFVGEGLAFAPVMRPTGDSTPDDELKRRWLYDGTIDRERILCAYDDRDKVVRMWRAEGITCFQVAPGDF